ncbi:MAG: glycosyltransferase [Ignavibacteria bacterium]|nr:glycosyltransferase [Ignavibacteria bacterium]
MRVALFSHGGIGRPGDPYSIPALVNLVTRLSAWCEVTVFVPATGHRENDEYRCGDALVIPVECRSSSSFPRIALAFLSRFRKEQRRSAFHLLHGLWAYPSGAVAVALARMHRTPSVVSVIGGEAAAVRKIRYGLLRHPFLKPVVLHTLAKADRVVVSTRFQIDCLSEHGLKRNDLEIVPSGISPDWLIPGWKRSPSPPFRILHVANLTQVKDQETLLRCFSIIRRDVDARLTIVGPDHMEGRIQQTAADLGLDRNVTFAGFVPQDQLRRYYEQSDLMLHTSLFEGQAVVLAEAAATGVVVCGTRVGLLSDLGSSSMRAGPVGDPAQLARNALELLENPREFATLQLNARQWAENHTIDWTAESYKRIYESVVSHS